MSFCYGYRHQWSAWTYWDEEHDGYSIKERTCTVCGETETDLP